MAQQRIRGLTTTYIQLASGDPGYVNPESVYLAVDSDNFDGEPQKMPLSDFYSATHIESGKETGLSSHSVTISFGTAFISSPKGINNLIVYRMSAKGGGYRPSDVLWYLDDASQPSTTGCDLTIDSSESLTGIIIEYYFYE